MRRREDQAYAAYAEVANTGRTGDLPLPPRQLALATTGVEYRCSRTERDRRRREPIDLGHVVLYAESRPQIDWRRIIARPRRGRAFKYAARRFLVHESRHSSSSNAFA